MRCLASAFVSFSAMALAAADTSARQPMNGLQLGALCELMNENDRNLGGCPRFMLGFMFGTIATPHREISFCPPSNVDWISFAEVTAAALIGRQELKTLPSEEAIATVMEATYPCKR